MTVSWKERHVSESQTKAIRGRSQGKGKAKEKGEGKGKGKATVEDDAEELEEGEIKENGDDMDVDPPEPEIEWPVLKSHRVDLSDPNWGREVSPAYPFDLTPQPRRYNGLHFGSAYDSNDDNGNNAFVGAGGNTHPHVNHRPIRQTSRAGPTSVHSNHDHWSQRPGQGYLKLGVQGPLTLEESRMREGWYTCQSFETMCDILADTFDKAKAAEIAGRNETGDYPPGHDGGGGSGGGGTGGHDGRGNGSDHSSKGKGKGKGRADDLDLNLDNPSSSSMNSSSYPTQRTRSEAESYFTSLNAGLDGPFSSTAAALRIAHKRKGTMDDVVLEWDDPDEVEDMQMARAVQESIESFDTSASNNLTNGESSISGLTREENLTAEERRLRWNELVLAESEEGGSGSNPSTARQSNFGQHSEHGEEDSGAMDEDDLFLDDGWRTRDHGDDIERDMYRGDLDQDMGGHGGSPDAGTGPSGRHTSTSTGAIPPPNPSRRTRRHPNNRSLRVISAVDRSSQDQDQERMWHLGREQRWPASRTPSHVNSPRTLGGDDATTRRGDDAGPGPSTAAAASRVRSLGNRERDVGSGRILERSDRLMTTATGNDGLHGSARRRSDRRFRNPAALELIGQRSGEADAIGLLATEIKSAANVSNIRVRSAAAGSSTHVNRPTRPSGPPPPPQKVKLTVPKHHVIPLRRVPLISLTLEGLDIQSHASVRDLTHGLCFLRPQKAKMQYKLHRMAPDTCSIGERAKLQHAMRVNIARFIRVWSENERLVACFFQPVDTASARVFVDAKLWIFKQLSCRHIRIAIPKKMKSLELFAGRRISWRYYPRVSRAQLLQGPEILHHPALMHQLMPPQEVENDAQDDNADAEMDGADDGEGQGDDGEGAEQEEENGEEEEAAAGEEATINTAQEAGPIATSVSAALTTAAPIATEPPASDLPVASSTTHAQVESGPTALAPPTESDLHAEPESATASSMGWVHLGAEGEEENPTQGMPGAWRGSQSQSQDSSSGASADASTGVEPESVQNQVESVSIAGPSTSNSTVPAINQVASNEVATETGMDHPSAQQTTASTSTSAPIAPTEPQSNMMHIPPIIPTWQPPPPAPAPAPAPWQWNPANPLPTGPAGAINGIIQGPLFDGPGVGNNGLGGTRSRSQSISSYLSFSTDEEGNLDTTRNDPTGLIPIGAGITRTRLNNVTAELERQRKAEEQRLLHHRDSILNERTSLFELEVWARDFDDQRWFDYGFELPMELCR